MLLAAGCGGGNGGSGSTAASTAAETADAPARPFPGGTVIVNTDGGYSLGAPHGWTPTEDSGVTVLRSPDGAVSLAVTSDRTDEALATPPPVIARSTIESLPGFTGVSAAGGAPFRAHYPGFQARGAGTRSSDGLPQDFRSFVLVRPQLAVFTALASRSAKARSPFASQVDSIVRSIRGRPVSVSG